MTVDVESFTTLFLPRAQSSTTRESADGEQALDLYALIDAGRVDTLIAKLNETSADYACLYGPELGADLALVGPYLVRLTGNPVLTRWMLECGWGDSWGVFLSAPESLTVLHEHFGRFILATLPEGKEVFFRFFDPRVLRVYLPTCTPEETQAFFGTVACFVVEGRDPYFLLRFRATEAGLSVEQIEAGQ